MPRYHRTEGICLRRIAYSNTSQVAGFLTPDAGRISVMAKGVTRAPKKGIRTGFDLAGRYALLYTERPGRALHILTERWLLEHFGGLRAALERTLCAYYAAELALNFTAEGEPCPRLYALLLQALPSFDRGEGLGLNVLLLEIGVLREQGSLPFLDACAGCGRRVPPRGTVRFDAAAGGPLCRRCEGEHRQAGRATSVRADVLHGLAALAAGQPQPALPPERVLAMSAVLRFTVRDLLGKELRMWKYLQDRKLSRSLRQVRARAGIR